MLTTCREIESALPLFFDGELDAHQVRAVAIHVAQCRTCEEEIRKLERLQESIASAVRELTERTLTDSLWPAVEKRLPRRRPALAERIRDWWQERSPRALLPVPVLAAAAAGFVIAAALLHRPEQPAIEMAASPPHESPVRVEAIESTSAVALLRDADTLALWIDEESPERASTPVSEAIPDLASQDIAAEPVAEELQ